MHHTQPLFRVEQQSADTSDDYYTPAWVFGALGLEFDLDVAAPPGGVPHIPARSFFTMADDGLSSEWFGRVWMNPPWSDAGPWVDRFVAHGHGVGLVPALKSAWFNRLWDEPTVSFTPAPASLKFIQGSVFPPALFIAAGAECVDALAALGRVR